MKRIVLVGLGHGHLHIVARARQYLDAGAQLILIDDGVFRYSSLAAGIVGGRYTVEQGMLNSAALAAACGASFIKGTAKAVDAQAHCVWLESGEAVAYDILSLNPGSEVSVPFPVAEGASVFRAKPLSDLIGLRDALRQRIAARQKIRLVIVGGGHSGCELAANAAALCRRYSAQADITLVAAQDRLMADAPAKASDAMAGILGSFGIELVLSTRCQSIKRDAVLLSDGSELPFDHVLLATGLRPSPIARIDGFLFDEVGGIRVGPTLQSLDDRSVFAIGDCARLTHAPRPDVGVFGVRAAPVLHHNLLAAVTGAKMREYWPQDHWFAALNLGDRTGFGMWGRLWWRGRSALFAKDRIDRRFMKGYRKLYERRAVRRAPGMAGPE